MNRADPVFSVDTEDRQTDRQTEISTNGDCSGFRMCGVGQWVNCKLENKSSVP
ncbi:MAG: hypothetical protein IJS02_03630 [Bacteroidales bacterium]|nr:hypothetical protein [Bacteroidales bacterium]